MPGVSLSSSEGYAKYLKDQSGIKLTLLNKTTKDGFVPLVDVKDDKKITVADGTEVTYVDELDKQSKSKYLVKYQGK
jgi:hypothetical protein